MHEHVRLFITSFHSDLSTATQQNLNEYFNRIAPVGTPVYMAPEVYNITIESNQQRKFHFLINPHFFFCKSVSRLFFSHQMLAYTRSCDVFSFGVLANEVITCQQPYEDEIKKFGSWQVIMKDIVSSSLRPVLSKQAPEPINELIRNCWKGEAITRPNFAFVESTISKILNELGNNNNDFEWPTIQKIPSQTIQSQQTSELQSQQISELQSQQTSESQSQNQLRHQLSYSDTQIMKKKTAQTLRKSPKANKTSKTDASSSFIGEKIKFSWDVNNRKLYKTKSHENLRRK